MKKMLFLVTGIVFLCLHNFAQDTFSIVAVDSVTGEVGSAGATCLDNSNISGGALIISDVHPGRGAVHTQASWRPGNQSNARNRMAAGDSPDQIITYVNANDVDGDSTIRQYGIVDFGPGGSPRSAGYTGVNTLDYKNHIVGPNYAIQGNILLGQEILDSMESRFLQTQGTLADKLMAALQGANVPGADTRCLSEGVSSRSAFLRVAKAHDMVGHFYLDLLVGETPFGEEPIDSLQTMYDNWTPPDCSYDIPASAIVINSDSGISTSNQVIWVCRGDTLTLTGNNNTILLESTAFFMGTSGNNNIVYLKDSAGMDGGNTLLTTIYHSTHSNIEYPGLVPDYTSCDSIYYTYENAPQDGCVTSSTGLDRFFSDTNISLFPNPAASHITLNVGKSIPEPVDIKWYDANGKIAGEQSIQLNAGFHSLEIPAGASEIYLLTLKTSKAVWSQKVVLR